MVKEGIVLQRVTHVALHTRLDQARVLEFLTYANQQIQTYGMDTRCIVNIDETNINFDLYGSFALEKHGARTIGMKNCFRYLGVIALCS